MRYASMRVYRQGLVSAVAWGLFMDVVCRVMSGSWLTPWWLAATIAASGLAALGISLVRHVRSSNERSRRTAAGERLRLRPADVVLSQP